ncbi:MAG TPA: hypothetical protein VHK90_08120 [Thermoanaerobaculia bacterium]|nr:hypothetical protein [Thermoanaerobaculia bacterium]
MRLLTPGFHRVWRGSFARLMAGAAMVVVSTSLLAAEVLFPQPLHITRKIEDPVSRTTTTVHEYCAGNQIVTVNGDKITIVDYAKQEMTEIDRADGTYSIARFDEIAKAMPVAAPEQQKRGASSNAEATAATRRWNARSLGAKTGAAGRAIETFEVTPEEQQAGTKVRMEVGVDTRVRLSRNAVEALIGASFPNPKRDEHEAILRASSGGRAERRVGANATTTTNAAAEPDYALPVEQSLSVDFDGRTLTLRNTIIDVRNELPPDTLRQLPPGARQVESRAVRMVREAHDLEFPTSTPPQQ